MCYRCCNEKRKLVKIINIMYNFYYYYLYFISCTNNPINNKYCKTVHNMHGSQLYCAFIVINPDWIKMKKKEWQINGTFRPRSPLSDSWWYVPHCFRLVAALFPVLCCESCCSARGPPRRHVIPFPLSHPEPRALDHRPAAGTCVFHPYVSRRMTEWRLTERDDRYDDGSGRPRAGPRAAGHSRTNTPQKNKHLHITLMTLTRALNALYGAFIKL